VRRQERNERKENLVLEESSHEGHEEHEVRKIEPQRMQNKGCRRGFETRPPSSSSVGERKIMNHFVVSKNQRDGRKENICAWELPPITVDLI
jgi:hypothetical protein